MASALQSLAGCSLRSICTGIDRFTSEHTTRKNSACQARCSLIDSRKDGGRVKLFRSSRRTGAGRLRAVDGGGQSGDAQNGIPKVSELGFACPAQGYDDCWGIFIIRVAQPSRNPTVLQLWGLQLRRTGIQHLRSARSSSILRWTFKNGVSLVLLFTDVRIAGLTCVLYA